MKVKSKEDVLNAYKSRYPDLDAYISEHLSTEYERYFEKIKNLKTTEEVRHVFQDAIELNEQRYRDNAHIHGVERALNNQYMSILASYGLIVFFRDNMIDW